MKIQVKHSLKTDVDSAFKLCTEQKSQEAIYGKLPGTDVKIKREGRAPNVKLKIARKMPANPPAAIKRLVPSTNEVSHAEDWAADGKGYSSDIVVEIKGVSVQWDFDITSGIPLLGGLIASFAGDELKKNLEDEFKVLKASI